MDVYYIIVCVLVCYVFFSKPWFTFFVNLFQDKTVPVFGLLPSYFFLLPLF